MGTPQLKNILKASAIKAVEKFRSSAVESIAKHSSNAVSSYMETNQLSYAYAPRSASDMYGHKYEEIRDELIAHGFTNITLFEKKDVKDNWFSRSDKDFIISVVINGRDNFKKKAKFMSDAHVVITYHGLIEKKKK